ncbi:hypothetical protein, partial [Malaciobacter molluscorum]|uniref:hypothetical protein n=1 Tax=Malaciobacter molluscorum TaxID=1032072 RepID=UPI001D172956
LSTADVSMVAARDSRISFSDAMDCSTSRRTASGGVWELVGAESDPPHPTMRRGTPRIKSRRTEGERTGWGEK